MYIQKTKVNVLMSTYNGEKFLREQIDSVLRQEDVDVQLWVRDDGSTDNTVEILKSYLNKGIKIFVGNNLGPARSFLRLLEICDNADYYAFCDQDDYWLPKKLKTAIDRMGKYSGKVLFASSYYISDEYLNIVSVGDMHIEKRYTLQDVLIHRTPSGCSMVFNHELKKIINTRPKYVRMHDYWTMITALAYNSKIIVSSQPLLIYRQHNTQVSGIMPSLKIKYKRYIISALYGKNERWRQALSALNSYGGEISVNKINVLKKIVDYRKTARNKYSLLCDKTFSGENEHARLLFKLSVLLNVF